MILIPADIGPELRLLTTDILRNGIFSILPSHYVLFCT